MMLKPLMKKYDSFVITEKTDYSAESKGEKTYYMKQVNRREKDFISISFYAFNSSGSKGIACSLNNLQKIADGEHLGGKASAEEDFATEEDDDFLS